MAIGRFICVGLPFALTIASIIALLVATLSGVTQDNLWMFEIDTTNLSVSAGDATSLAGKFGLNLRALENGNISALDFGLANKYEVTLWGYCTTTIDGQRQCTKPEFDWANKALNTSTIEQLSTLSGTKIQLPSAVQDSLKTFRTVTKWTEVAFIVALIALGVELGVGIFASCSRAASCLTWLVASIAAALVGVAAGLATAMASVVVGAVDGTAKLYGVKGSIGGRFLAAVWVATAFAIAAAFFWIFTICCCKPEHRQKTRGKRFLDDGGEKLLPPSAYRPVSTNQYEMHGAQPQGFHNPAQDHAGFSTGPRYPSGQGRTDLAYEPYSHRT